MKIKIDKDIKPRETRGRKGGRSTPWGDAARELKVGESFLLDAEEHVPTVRWIIEQRGLHFHRETEGTKVRVFVLNESFNAIKTREKRNGIEAPDKGKLGLPKGKV